MVYMQGCADHAQQMMVPKKDQLNPDRCDYNVAQRRIEWTINNFRGGQNRELELSLTFKKDVLIDET